MRILLAATRMGIGGAETHILTLARALHKRGHYVHIVSAGGAYIPALISSKITHTVLPLDRKDIISVIKSARAIKSLAIEGHFDVVHAHGRIPAFICGMLSKQKGFPPFAVTAHGFYDPALPMRAFTLWGRRTVAVSEDVKAFLVEKYKLPPESIDVIINGVDTEVPEHQPSKRLRIVTASRLDGDTSLCPLLLCELITRIRRDFPECATEEILSAVRYHATGRDNMSTLQMAVFLADYIEPGRPYVGCQEARALFWERAERDGAPSALEDTVFDVLGKTLIHLTEKKRFVDLETVAAFNDFVRQKRQ